MRGGATRRCWDIVEERQRSKWPAAAARSGHFLPGRCTESLGAPTSRRLARRRLRRRFPTAPGGAEPAGGDAGAPIAPPNHPWMLLDRRSMATNHPWMETDRRESGTDRLFWQTNLPWMEPKH